jgi:GT2 family glycosyltransferase
MTSTKFISVIVVNYNSGNKLQEAIQSVFDAFSNIEDELIIVDNASSDNSLALVKSTFSDRETLVIQENTQNLGFASACNIGAKKASGNYLLFLNPDCILLENTLIKLVKYLDEQAEIGMVGGLLINPDGTEQVGGRRLIPTPFRALVHVLKLSPLANRYPRLFVGFNLHKQPLPKEPIEVEAISGACILVKRKAVEDVGLWDEDYFLHCEDLDWCMRFGQKGWKIFFVPDAKIVHYQGACSRSRPVFVEWHKHKGMMHFYGKFFKHQYPGPLMWLVGMAVWMRFSLIAGYYTFQKIRVFFRFDND